VHRPQQISASAIVGARVPVRHHHADTMDHHQLGQRPHCGAGIRLGAAPEKNGLLCRVAEQE
jgi:hypothetical protein